LGWFWLGWIPSAAVVLHNKPCFLATQSLISHFTPPTAGANRTFSSLQVSLLLLSLLVSVAGFLRVLFGFLLLLHLTRLKALFS